MTEVLFYAVTWCATGFAVSLIGCAVDWWRGEDIKLSDAAFLPLLAALWPAVVVMFFSQLVAHYVPWGRWGRVTIVRGRRR